MRPVNVSQGRRAETYGCLRDLWEGGGGIGDVITLKEEQTILYGF
jgi:hypothetical protein